MLIKYTDYILHNCAHVPSMKMCYSVHGAELWSWLQEGGGKSLFSVKVGRTHEKETQTEEVGVRKILIITPDPPLITD